MPKLNELGFAELLNKRYDFKRNNSTMNDRRNKPIVRIEQICEMKWLHFYYSFMLCIEFIRQLNSVGQ